MIPFLGSLIIAPTFLALKVALLIWFHCSEPLSIQTLTILMHKMIFDILIQGRIQSLERGGGTLLKKLKSKKKEKKKRVITIIASYPLPNILYHIC